jgi:succinyldiaminopimelate transaminase
VTRSFQLPPYPYDSVGSLGQVAAAHDGGAVDLSIGTPCDPPPRAVVEALSSSDTERGYPTSLGSPRFREAAAGWMARRFGIDVPIEAIAACVGTKELVASAAQHLKIGTGERDRVLHPAVAYPTYEMSATLAGLQSVPVGVDEGFRLDVSSIAASDAEHALLLWANTPGNPAGNLDDLGAIAAWGVAHDVPVFSDECYVEFTWDGPARSVLDHGLANAVAVHSLSKRSNLAGLRVGFYAGDPAIVEYLGQLRRHAGMMVPGPVQVAAAIALDDDEHVKAQRERYLERLEYFRGVLAALGVHAPLPGGGFYLWAPAPDGDAWAFAERMAKEGGAVVSPGNLYGPAGAGYVRVALVQPMERLQLVAQRLGVA